MRRRVAAIAVMAVMASGASGFVAPAQAAEPRGPWCSENLGFSVGTTIYSLMSGGPLVSQVPGELVTLKCTLQVGSSQHWGADALVATSGAPAAVAVVPPTFQTYPGLASGLYVCSEATIGAVTYYYDAANLGWSTSNAVDCDGVQLAPQVNQAFVVAVQLVNDIIQLVNDVSVGVVDPLVCPALRSLFPPEGDVPAVWDCPPYGNSPGLDSCAALGFLAPGVPGVVDVDPTGDVYVLGEQWLDCPPYAS